MVVSKYKELQSYTETVYLDNIQYTKYKEAFNKCTDCLVFGTMSMCDEKHCHCETSNI